MLKDVFTEGTHLSLCLNVSPASKDFCDETLQLLEQMSLPQKLGSAGTQRYVTLQVPDMLRLALIRSSCRATNLEVPQDLSHT